MSNDQSPKAYVYLHRRESDGQVFYVGKGSDKSRMYQKTGRNAYWKRTADKHGWSAEFVMRNMTDADAFKLEQLEIAKYRAAGAPLTNVTAGGEGLTGYKQTAEHIAKRVAKQTGSKWSQECRDRVKGRTMSSETRDKISKSVSGFRHTKEARRKISEAQVGAKHHLFDAVVRVFSHPEHGVVATAQNDLMRRFDLHRSNLCSIIKGRKKSCSGWTYSGVQE